MLPAAGDALTFGERMLAALTPGADLQGVGSALVVRLFDQMAAAASDPPIPAALAHAAAEVRALHSAVAAGLETAQADWKVARRLAMQATNALSDPDHTAFAQCVETAAWNPLRSPSCIYDTLRVWRGALHDQEIRAFGWSELDDRDIETTLGRLHDTYLLNAPQLGITVFDLLEQHHPEKALRLRENFRHRRESSAATTRRAVDMLFDVLESTACPSSPPPQLFNPTPEIASHHEHF